MERGKPGGATAARFKLATRLRWNSFPGLQLCGWSLWALFLALWHLFFVSMASGQLLPLVLVCVADAGIALVLTSGLRHLYRAVRERPLGGRLLIAVFACLPAALLWQWLRNGVAGLPFAQGLDLHNSSPMLMEPDGGWFTTAPGLLLAWSALYFIIRYHRLLQVEKERSRCAEARHQEARRLMLRYQLNPHFLFNSLNAISALVLTEATGKANEMIVKLAKLLRWSLDHAPLQRVSLARELDSVRLFLDLEKVRFAERLRLELHIDEEAAGALLPTLLLQPLIENSVRHGVARSESGGVISITAKKHQGKLLLELSDDGPGMSGKQVRDAERASAGGLGLGNVRHRLQEIYGDGHTLEFINARPRGLTVRVVIPWETDQ